MTQTARVKLREPSDISRWALFYYILLRELPSISLEI